MISHKKEFGVYHWDTFDDETTLLDEFDSLPEASKYVKKRCKGRLNLQGADVVNIVNSKGTVIEHHRVS